MKRRYLFCITAYAALTASASAAQVTLTDTWQSLGTGPLSISVLNGDGLFEASATAPTDYGQPIFRNQNPYAFNSTLTIWGKRRSTAASPIAVTSPISVGSGGSGGGGSGGAITAPLGSNTKANSVSVTYATDQLLPAFATAPTVSVSNFPATQPVSGTIAATQSGAYTVTQGPAGTAKWLVDGSGVTQPVSVASLPLPAGASTAANQPTNAAQGSTTSGQTGNLQLAAAASAAPALTTAQSYPLSLTLAGALRVDGSAVTQPISATALPLPTGAATSALQSNVQTASGTAASTLVGVQGNSTMVPLQVTVTNPSSGSGSSGSVTAAGTNGTTAQAIQGINGGIAVPVSGTFFQATQPISATALPLPTGASTAANQTNVQTAPGTSASTAMGVQGVTGGVALSTTPTNAATVATAANQNSTAAGTSATNAQGVQGVTGGIALPTNQTQQAGTALGAPTAYGTAPTGNVIGTNTNVLASVLPTGAATSAAQTTGNNSLATIATNTTGAATAANQVPLVYTLLSNFTTNASGTAQVVNGGGYYLNISGTFGGATVTITTTVNGVATSSTYTAAVSALSLNVGAATTFQASVSGGTGASITATLNGFGPAVAAAGTSTAAQGTGGTSAWSVYEAGSALATAGIAPAVSTGGTSQVGKTSAGNFYSAYAIATAANTAQAYLVCIDATAAPAAGATITPKDFAAFNSTAIGGVASVNFGSGPPDVYTTGITCLATTSMTTYTAAATSAFNVRVR